MRGGYLTVITASAELGICRWDSNREQRRLVRCRRMDVGAGVRGQLGEQGHASGWGGLCRHSVFINKLRGSKVLFFVWSGHLICPGYLINGFCLCKGHDK